MNEFLVYYSLIPGHILCKEPLLFSSDLLPIAHCLVRKLKAANLADVYMAMQGEVWSPRGEARGLIASLGLGHTSLSVGDVVQDQGACWMCAEFGWKQLPNTLTPAQRDALIAALACEQRHLSDSRGEWPNRRPPSLWEVQAGAKMLALQKYLEASK